MRHRAAPAICRSRCSASSGTSSNRSRKRRDVDPQHVQAVVEVLAEGAFGDLVEEVALGGGDDADVGLDGRGAADALEDFLLDRPQQFRLLRQGDVVNVVEIEGAAFGQIEAAFAALVGAGEGALLVPVKLALDELRGKERAAGLDEGEAVAVGAAMDDAGHQVLAHAGLAAQEHVGVGAGADLDHVLDAIHRRRAADDQAVDVGAGSGAAGAAPGGGGRCRRSIRAKQREDVLVAERLGDEIEGPQPHRLDGHRDAAVGGHHHHFHAGQRPLLDPLQQFDAVQVRHFQVGDDHVEAVRLQQVPGLLAVGGGDHLVALGAEVVRQGDAFDLFVVNDQDFHGLVVVSHLRRAFAARRG